MLYQPKKARNDENAVEKMRQLICSARNNDLRKEFNKLTQNSPISAANKNAVLGDRSVNLQSAGKFSEDSRLYLMDLPPKPYPQPKQAKIETDFIVDKE